MCTAPCCCQPSNTSFRGYRSAIALDATRSQSHSNLGLLLHASRRYVEAERHLRVAARLEPAAAEILSNLANLLTQLGQDAESERLYRRAISLKPGAPEAYANLAALLATAGRNVEAEHLFRAALAIAPEHPLARVNLGYLLLGQGRLAEGWPYHEARYDPASPEPAPLPPLVEFPQWRGESLVGKSLLIWPEQGMGDEIQFCRYVPLLKARGARHITLVCKPPLRPLMETIEEADSVLTTDAPEASLAHHDYWTFPLSVPLHVGTTLDTIPSRLPYLRAEPARLTHWAARLPADAPKVGIVWRGNSNNPNDEDRSLSALSLLSPLWSVHGLRFISLQKGAGEAEALECANTQPLLHLGSDIRDFGDSARIVQQLDLVITVDTAIAHVAGALGKPCWVLLPAHKTDWRWLQGRDDSPGYPGTMRLFRQRQRGRWDDVVEQIVIALDAFRRRE